MRHDDPVASSGGSVVAGNNRSLVKPQAALAKVIESLDHEKSHVGVGVDRSSSTFESDGVAVSTIWVANAVASDLIPDEAVDESLPISRPVDEAGIDLGIDRKHALISWLSWVAWWLGDDRCDRRSSRGSQGGSVSRHVRRTRRSMVVLVADKSRPADGIMVDSLVEGSTDGTPTVCPAVESLATIASSNSGASLDTFGSVGFNVSCPRVAIGHLGSGTHDDPRVDTVSIWNLNGHLGSDRVLFCRVWPGQGVVPVHLAGRGPVGMVMVVSNTAVTEDEVFPSFLLCLRQREDTEKCKARE